MSKTAPKTYISSGHSGCAGCCDAFAAKFTLMGSGPDTIVVNPTGCLEVMSTPFPNSSWQVPVKSPGKKEQYQDCSNWRRRFDYGHRNWCLIRRF